MKKLLTLFTFLFLETAIEGGLQESTVTRRWDKKMSILHADGSPAMRG